MRIVVTGGAGRLGQLAINDLLDHGHEVVSRETKEPFEMERPTVDLCRCSRRCCRVSPCGRRQLRRS